MDEQDPKDFSLPVLTLESPSASEGAGGGSSTLFPDGELLVAIHKVAALETFLQLLIRDLKFNEFMRELLLNVMNAVKSEAGSILEVDPKEKCFFFRAVVGTRSDHLATMKVPLGKGIVGHVYDSKQPYVVNNIEENKVHLKAIQNAVGFETRNMVALPILVRGQVFAVLEVLNRVGESDYLTEDVELLVYLCDMAAKAIEVRLMMNWSKAQSKGNAA